jgi:thymidylate kinase
VTANRTADFDLAGFVRVRVVGGEPEIAAVGRQLGLEPTDPEGEPDITVEVSAEVDHGRLLRHLGRDEAAFSEDGFYVLRSKGKSRAKVRIPFEDIGDGLVIRCEAGLVAVPLLIPILAVTALGKGLVPLHAGAFTWNGAGVVVTGWSKGGKTETLLATTQAGARYVGDEWCYIDPQRSVVVGIPEPVTVWAWHLRHLPALRTAVPNSDRLRMALLEAPDRIESALPERLQSRRLGRLLRRLAFQTRSRANAWLDPGDLFGADGATVVPFDHVVLVMSTDSQAVTLTSMAAPEIASRMVASVHYELDPLLQAYRMFRFAFPDRRSKALDGVEPALEEALERALSGRRGWRLEHPYPVDLPALAEALRPVVGAADPTGEETDGSGSDRGRRPRTLGSRSGRGATVAIVGPDGAGKTTVAARLARELPLPVSYMYMGVSAESSNRMLPTTRLVRAVRRRKGTVERGPRAVSEAPSGPQPLSKRLRAVARTANRIAEESYRQSLASWQSRRGRVVLFDRHFFADYYLHDVAAEGPLPLSRRVHGFFISRVLPRPELFVYLDVPAEVLFARKGEGTVELLEQMRGSYRSLEQVADDFVVVDADRPLDDVVADVADAVVRHVDGGGR